MAVTTMHKHLCGPFPHSSKMTRFCALHWSHRGLSVNSRASCTVLCLPDSHLQGIVSHWMITLFPLCSQWERISTHFPTDVQVHYCFRAFTMNPNLLFLCLPVPFRDATWFEQLLCTFHSTHTQVRFTCILTVGISALLLIPMSNLMLYNTLPQLANRTPQGVSKHCENVFLSNFLTLVIDLNCLPSISCLLLLLWVILCDLWVFCGVCFLYFPKDYPLAVQKGFFALFSHRGRMCICLSHCFVPPYSWVSVKTEHASPQRVCILL